VTIHTALTKAFGLQYPIVLAPMNQIAGGRLAAAVSNAGGLGLVGGGYGDPEWLQRELTLVQGETDRPWGVGLITWHATREVVDLALRYRPDAFLLSFGEARLYAPSIKAAGCTLLCQVQDVEMAREAVAAGADFIVAQGSEAGGHGAAGHATFPLVPAVVDAVAPIPVLAAGGIADGRGLAAALTLGSQGVMIGTRFAAATESLMHEQAKAQIVTARAADTARTQVFDIIRELSWPEPYNGRAVRNRFFTRWHGRERELAAALETELPTYQRAVAQADFDTAVIFAGESVELIDAVVSAAELVQRIGAEAETQLRRVVALLTEPPEDQEDTLVAR
jgi:nitronate monooxygenase